MAALLSTLLLAAALISTCISETVEQALAKSYAPIRVQCPSDIQWIRPADGLNPLETSWVQGRKPVVLAAFEEYLERLGLEDFDVAHYVNTLYYSNYTNVPTLGLAISGGGWASAFTGTGALRALDARLDAATTQRTGGLLQSLTYMAGLSGGSFPTLSFPSNNWPTADEILSDWYPEIDRLTDVTNSTPHAETSTAIFEDLAAKAKAGFNISTEDYFGRAWGNEWLPGPNGGLNLTLSSLVNQSKFIAHQVPFPIIQLSEVTSIDVQYYNLSVPPANATIYDLTPFEFGSWDGSANVFTPTQWLGTSLLNGSVVNTSDCVLGFDRTSFMIGSTGGAFNMWDIEAVSNGSLAPFSKRSLDPELTSKAKRSGPPESELESFVEGFAEVFGLNLSSIAYAVWPNPFAGLATSSPLIRDDKDLKLVDGSESGQALPFWGLLHRGLDLIIAWDDNSDAPPYNWNNGTNLYDTFIQANASGLPFPVVPPANTFVNKNYTLKPVFFGCEANLTTTNDTRSPIILYAANAPYSAYTNISYVQSSTTLEQMNEIFVNSFNILTQGNGTLDDDFVTCLGCAAIDRSLVRVGLNRTSQCSSCLAKHCWDGTYDNTEPDVVNPTLLLNATLGFDEWNLTNPF